MAEPVLPSAEYLRQRLHYDSSTGIFVWLRCGFMENKWNSKFAGKRAFATRRRDGYLSGSIDGKSFLAHRVAWFLAYGDWPGVIDHINGDKADNRIENLRSVSQRENMRNIGLASNNKTGVTGVHRSGKSDKWVAQIRVGRKTVHLGTFDTLSDALAARLAAEQQYEFHANHGRRLSVRKPDSGSPG